MWEKVLLAAVSFIVGAAVVVLICAVADAIRRRKRMVMSGGSVGAHTDEKKRLKKPKTSTVALIVVAVYILWFTDRMIGLYEATGAIPDTLVTCVFAICGGECGALGWIRTSKEKYRDRKWGLEDEKRMNEAAMKVVGQDDSLEPAFTAESRRMQER